MDKLLDDIEEASQAYVQALDNPDKAQEMLDLILEISEDHMDIYQQQYASKDNQEALKYENGTAVLMMLQASTNMLMEHTK